MLGFGKGAAFLQKYLHFLLLPVENLGDFHAGEVLGQKGIDIGTGVRHLPVGPAGEAAEQHRIQKNKGYENQHHQGKAGVQQEHGHQNAYQHQHLLGHVHQHVGKHHGDGVGVVGDTGHQLAGGNLVQLIVGQLFNVGKDAQPEAGENLLTGLLQDDGLEIGADHGDNQNSCIHHHPADQGRHGKACLLHQLLNASDHVRGQKVIGKGYHGNDKCQQKGLPVGLGKGQQAANQLRILHEPLLLGGLFLSHKDGGNDEGHGEHQHDPCHNENGQILSHCCVPLLPLPAAAGLPSSGSPGRSHTNPRACRRPPPGPGR